MGWAYLAISAIKAASQYQQGQTQKKLYNLQAQQAEIAGQRDKLRYGDQAQKVTEQMLAVNAAIAARSSAGGVSAFSGSSALVQRISGTRAGKEWLNSVEAGTMAETMGQAQAGVLRASGKQAAQSATIGAITTLAMAGASAYGMGTTPSPGAAGGVASTTSVPFSWSNVMNYKPTGGWFGLGTP